MAIIDMEKCQRLLKDRNEAFEAVRSFWSKMAGADPEQVEEIIKEVIQATRKIKTTPKS
ncbi:MAG: hypothetical protein ACOZF2_09135 [Thermodesulfobacteriota bacterium]